MTEIDATGRYLFSFWFHLIHAKSTNDLRVKNRTVIGNNVFIGSDTMLVPPVKIGKGSIVAAGSVITEDVPDDAMAVSRGRQINIPDGALKYREKKEKLK